MSFRWERWVKKWFCFIVILCMMILLGYCGGIMLLDVIFGSEIKIIVDDN